MTSGVSPSQSSGQEANVKLTKTKLDKAMNQAEDELIKAGLIGRDGSGNMAIITLLTCYAKLIEDIVEIDV